MSVVSKGIVLPESTSQGGSRDDGEGVQDAVSGCAPVSPESIKETYRYACRRSSDVPHLQQADEIHHAESPQVARCDAERIRAEVFEASPHATACTGEAGGSVPTEGAQAEPRSEVQSSTTARDGKDTQEVQCGPRVSTTSVGENTSTEKQTPHTFSGRGVCAESGRISTDGGVHDAPYEVDIRTKTGIFLQGQLRSGEGLHSGFSGEREVCGVSATVSAGRESQAEVGSGTERCDLAGLRDCSGVQTQFGCGTHRTDSAGRQSQRIYDEIHKELHPEERLFTGENTGFTRVVNVSEVRLDKIFVYDILEVPKTHKFFCGLDISKSPIASKNCIDEMNFMAQGAATINKPLELANAVTRRLVSRFMQRGGEIPGLCVFISSKRASGDFIEKRARKNRGKPGTYIVDGPIWEFSTTEYCGDTF